jgi:hypothetical protein
LRDEVFPVRAKSDTRTIKNPHIQHGNDKVNRWMLSAKQLPNRFGVSSKEFCFCFAGSTPERNAGRVTGVAEKN